MDISLLIIISFVLTQSACDVCVSEDIDSGRSDVCHDTAKTLSLGVNSKEAHFVSVTVAFQRIELTYEVEGLARDDMAISCSASGNATVDHTDVKLLPYNYSHLSIYVSVVIGPYAHLHHQQLNCTLWEMSLTMPFPTEEIKTKFRERNQEYIFNVLMRTFLRILGVILAGAHFGYPGIFIFIAADVSYVISNSLNIS